jgi:hypothetical protein
MRLLRRSTALLALAAGCGSVTGLGLPRREVTLRFWRTLGSAMHLAKTSAADVTMLKGSMPGIFGTA